MNERERYRGQSVDEVEWSCRTRNCLKNAGIATLGELMDYGETRLLRIENFGRKSLNEVKEVLSSMGLWICDSPYRVTINLRAEDFIQLKTLADGRPIEGLNGYGDYPLASCAPKCGVAPSQQEGTRKGWGQKTGIFCINSCWGHHFSRRGLSRLSSRLRFWLLAYGLRQGSGWRTANSRPARS